MTGSEIRKAFLDYFAAQGHTVVRSSSLIPVNDPTLLFTNAGMVQFKKVFLGEERLDYVRAASSQKCMRAGGKHNDLENVGRTARHHTFFEMLGNFSFGDYFKAEAISFAWSFLTEELRLPREKLWVTVYQDDDEAHDLWHTRVGLPLERIVRLGEKDNFWAMGDTGPCGPCSEILIDQGEKIGCKRPDCRVGCDCDRYLELWNLVFMQYYRNEKGELYPLPKPSIDTGMGLERIAAVMQGKTSNYDSDLFQGIIQEISNLARVPYGKDEESNMAMRVLADHGRATTFLIADGVLPSNEGRGYVLRRIIRRAIRYGRVLGLTEPFLARVTSKITDVMGATYPELQDSADFTGRVFLNEEERFAETLDFGLRLLEEEIARLNSSGSNIIPGETAFKLYDTYGFPLDIIQDVGRENGFQIDHVGFEKNMARQRELSRKAWKGGLAIIPVVFQDLLDKGQHTAFVGYEMTSVKSEILLLVKDGESVSQARQGERIEIVVGRTPFYTEAGGQVGDQGFISGREGTVAIEETVVLAGRLYVHRGTVNDGQIKTGEQALLSISAERRQAVALNHTATHLLQAALKDVLGQHVRQSGSLVAPDRLRFDFTHFSPVESGELERIEAIVNKEIRKNDPVETGVYSLDEAMKSGAVALFGEKYGEEVRVVSIGSFSKELCGGTHVRRTGEIGFFKITTETGVAAGIRRVEAVTGQTAVDLLQERDRSLRNVGYILKVNPEDVESKVERLISRQKELEREVYVLTAKVALQDTDVLLGRAQLVNGVKVLSTEVAINNPKTLRELGDVLRDKIGSGIIVLGGICEGKALIVSMVTKDLLNRFNAGTIARRVAEFMGGSGGGRPDMAQAGSTMTEKLAEALDMVPGIIKEESV